MHRQNRRLCVFRGALGSLAFLMATGSASATYTPPPACNNPFTPQQEVTEGAKVAAQVYKTMPVLPESDPVSQYVAQLGAHLVSHAPGLKWPFTFHVVASQDVNAFALPGGSIFVNLGTIQAAETEAQLAGVMAHETSHVVLRHSTCNMKKQQTTNLVAGLGEIASQILLGSGAAGQIGQVLIGGSSGLYGLHMSRDDEKQADLLGTDILYNSGYDPRGMPQFFEIIQGKYGNGGAQLLTDHPNPGNRTEYVTQEIATLPRHPDAIVTSAAFTRIHALALKEPSFTAQQVKDGVWKNANYASGPGQHSQSISQDTGQPQPPGAQYGPEGPASLNRAQLGIGTAMVNRNGNHFRIDAPASWQLAADANGGATLAPPGGSGTFGLVYGAVIASAPTDGVTDEDSLASATQHLAQQISQQNGGLQQIGQTQTLKVNGLLANAMEFHGRSPLVENGNTLQEHDWLIAMKRSDGDLHYIVFVAPERDFAALQPTFRAMLKSFQPQ